MIEISKTRFLLLSLLLAPAWAGALETPALDQLKGMAAATGAPAPAAVPAAKAGPVAAISWQDAPQHVGETVEIEGLIVKTYANAKVCFLNFSPDFKQNVTLVIFGAAYSKFPSGPEFYFNNQVVRASGRLTRSTMGQLQLILNDPEQIKIIKEGTQIPVVDWEDVTAKDAGRVLTVEGTIDSVTAAQKVAFLNFHKNWTRYMAGVVFASVLSRFPQDLVAAYQGHKVHMTGTVKVFDGHPEIVLLSPSQIKVLDPGAAIPARRIELAKDRIVYDDGDSITYTFGPNDGVTGANGAPFSGDLRLLGYDTPEITHPKDGIFFNQEHGKDAARLTNSLLAAADKIEFLTRGEHDKYGRVLGYLYVDGKLLGVLQIKAGLAYETVSAYGDNGFPEQAALITKAWEKSPIAADLKAGRKPPFINPGLWRQIYQMHGKEIPNETWAQMSDADRAKVIAETRKVAKERIAQMNGSAPAPTNP